MHFSSCDYFALLCRDRKITELEEELKVVGNAMKSLEIFEQEVGGIPKLSIRLLLLLLLLGRDYIRLSATQLLFASILKEF